MTNTKHTLIIAEAGVNHNGSLDLAKQLIDVASEAGADYVKFQTFKANKLVTQSATQAEYQKKNTGKEESQLEMLKKLELSYEDHLTLIEYCNKKNIKFLSTAFDEESMDLLYKLGISIFKVPSGEITNLPYLRKIGSMKRKVILSSGMAFLEEIKQAIDILKGTGIPQSDIIVLHCNTEYPTPMVDVNLNAMNGIKNELGVEIGYSDHTLGIEVPVAAVALGATVIEKHFTLSRQLEGPDHKASLEPEELKQMVKSIRNIEQAMGSGVKQPSDSEKKNIVVARRSICYGEDMKKGHVLQANDLVMKRPGDGISPMMVDSLIGKSLLSDVKKDQQFKWEDLNR